MRSYEESMQVIESALERFPGRLSGSSQLHVERAPGGSWWAIVRLWLPMSDNPEMRRQKITIESRSCECEKVLDSLAGKIEETLAVARG